MEEIIAPIDKELIKSELTEDRFLRDTNRAGNQIYVVDYQCAPNTVKEIGRLREIAFRDGGGGTGTSCDIDKFDTDPAYGFKQLVLWDPENECIVGGYRYACLDDAVYDRFGQPILPSSHMFQFTKSFLHDKFLHTIELGRSFVAVEYQSTREDSKSLYALDNLFDGLGALIVLYDGRMKHFFGKMTTYPTYPQEALEMILYFLDKHFGIKRGEKMVIIRNPVKVSFKNRRKFKKIFTEDDFPEDYKILKAEIHNYGVNIPPLVNTYMNMSPSMKCFGGGVNDEFGNVIDTGILLSFDELKPEKTKRHVHLPEIHLARLLNIRERIASFRNK